MNEKLLNEYRKMYAAYIENESAYWDWAEKRILFNERKKEKFYYKKGVSREKRKQLVERVLQDFPKATWREVCSQTGGCKEIIWEFNFWESPNDYYWSTGYGNWEVYNRLRYNPWEIYEAIENIYAWSQIIHINTTDVGKFIPKLLEDIGKGNIF